MIDIRARCLGLVCLAFASWLSCPTLADERAPNRRPVAAIGPVRLAVGGEGVMPLYVTGDWSRPMPGIIRAVLVLHGRLRNADVYFKSGQKAQAAAGEAGQSALIIAPQFLAQADVEAFGLPAETLRWTREGWEGGEPALGPTPTSSFAALDAVLARLSDKHLFPNLKHVVVAGHSGGGQVVQRYAITGKGEEALAARGIAVSYVVANPSSYAYFGPSRPLPVSAEACPRFNDWKYGMDNRPAYVAQSSAADLERSYVARHVIYLLGTRDTDPHHPALDRSCMAEAQGPYRYIRGHTYAAAMRARDNGTPNHQVWDVQGVGHDGDAMLTSRCGLAALFGTQSCPSASGTAP